jgi:hypothetical protein
MPNHITIPARPFISRLRRSLSDTADIGMMAVGIVATVTAVAGIIVAVGIIGVAGTIAATIDANNANKLGQSSGLI